MFTNEEKSFLDAVIALYCAPNRTSNFATLSVPDAAKKVAKDRGEADPDWETFMDGLMLKDEALSYIRAGIAADADRKAQREQAKNERRATAFAAAREQMAIVLQAVEKIREYTTTADMDISDYCFARNSYDMDVIESVRRRLGA